MSPESMMPPSALRKDLVLPDRMVNSATAARSLVDSATEAHAYYWNEIEHCQNHMQGQRPMYASKLKELGLDWMSNYNYGKATGKIEQLVGLNVWFVISALAMASPQFRQWREKDGEGDDAGLLAFLLEPDLRLKFSSCVKNALIMTLIAETRMQKFFNVVEYNATAWGYCPVTRNHTDWLGCANHVLSIAFEDHSKPEDVRLWVAFDTIKADYLYAEYVAIIGRANKGIIKDGQEKVEVVENWVIEGMEEALLSAYKGDIKRGEKEAEKDENRQQVTWETILPQFVADPSEALRNCRNIPIAKIYNYESDGTLTETYVVYDRISIPKRPATGKNSTVQNVEAGGKYFLFQKNHDDKKEQWRFLNIISASGFTQNGFIQEFRGIAKFAVEDSVRFNRQKNDLNDKLKIAGSPMFSQPSTNMGQAFRLQAMGPYTIAPVGFSLVPNQPVFDLNNHIIALGMEEQHYVRETEHYDAKVSDGLSSRPTEEEVAAKSAEVRDLRTVRGMLKLADYAQLFYSILIALAEAKDSDYDDGSPAKGGHVRFWDEVMAKFRKYGITDRDEVKKIILLISHLEIDHISRDRQAIEASMLDVETKTALNRLRRMHLISLGHSVREIDKLIPQDDEDNVDLYAMRRAADENAQFELTKEIVYIDSDPPVEHLDMHFNRLNKELQTADAGGDPVSSYNTLLNGLSHTAFHIEKMVNSEYYKRFAKKYLEMQAFFTGQLQQVQGMAQQRVQEVTEGQEQAAQQNGQRIDPVAQAKVDVMWYHAQEKEKRTNYLAEVRRGEREDDQQFKQRLKMEDHQLGMAQKQQLAGLQNQLAIAQASIKLATNGGSDKTKAAKPALAS